MRLRFVDRLVSLSPQTRVVAEKCATFEEAMLLRPNLARHVPHTLMLEWLGQTTAILVAESTGYERLPVIGSFASCHMEHTLFAGDVARITIDVTHWREDCAIAEGEIRRGDDLILSIERALCAFIPLEKLWDATEFRAAVRAARGEFPKPESVLR